MSFLIILAKTLTVIVTGMGLFFGIGLVLVSILPKDHLQKLVKRYVGYGGRVFLFIVGTLMLAGMVWLFSIVF